MGETILELRDVSVVRGRQALLEGIDWTVERGEHWAVVGRNGSGKTTLISVASSYVWPTTGSVRLLGHALGRVDSRQLRRRVGLVSAMLAPAIPGRLTSLEVVLAGATGATAPWWDRHGPPEHARAQELLELVGCAEIRDRPFDVLSSGERQRVQIARALMPDPALLLLDEPAAGLDLGARERLMVPLSLVTDGRVDASVLVTHHLEEIPAGTTHGLVLSADRIVAAGRIADVLTGSVLSSAFGIQLSVREDRGRYSAVAER